MAELAVKVPEDIREEVEKHPEINWSELRNNISRVMKYAGITSSEDFDFVLVHKV